MLKIFKSIFQTIRWILFIFGMMIDTVSKYPAHSYDLKVKVTDLKFFILKFFKSSYFPRAHIFLTIRWILFIFGMMIDTGPKFYSTIPLSMPMASRSKLRT